MTMLLLTGCNSRSTDQRPDTHWHDVIAITGSLAKPAEHSAYDVGMDTQLSSAALSALHSINATGVC
jgi:hypothetical protein